MNLAFQDLTSKGKILWIYFAKNNNEYQFYLSEKDLLNFGIGSSSSYDRAVKELIEKGYLKKISNNIYHFHEIKQKNI